MKFGGIMQSSSGELLADRKFPKNPSWPPAPKRQFSGFVQRKGYLLLQFESDLSQTWYTCSVGYAPQNNLAGFFNFCLERLLVAILSKIGF